MSLLGIDLGTIGCKALLFDNAGNRLAKSYREYSMVTGHGGIAELDSVSVMNDVRAVIREASASAGDDAIEFKGSFLVGVDVIVDVETRSMDIHIAGRDVSGADI